MPVDTITVQTTLHGSEFGLDASNRPVSRLSDGKQYGVVLHNPTTGELIGANGSLVSGGGPVDFTANRALTADDNGKILVSIGGARIATVPAGLTAGYEVDAVGPITFSPASGAVTITDQRATGSPSPVCSLINISTDVYNVVGSKP
jgi:hypothetical protein